MRRILAIFLFFCASGCSSAPVADFLDWVSPSPVRPQAANPAPIVPATQPALPPRIIVQPPDAPPPSPPPTTVNRAPIESGESQRPPMPPLPDIPGSR